jgi:hypothetical protein
LLFTDRDLFNRKMSDWIVFYNTELPQSIPAQSKKLLELPAVGFARIMLAHHDIMRLARFAAAVQIQSQRIFAEPAALNSMPSSLEDRAFKLCASINLPSL